MTPCGQFRQVQALAIVSPNANPSSEHSAPSAVLMVGNA
jgi:hypothetical protein